MKIKKQDQLVILLRDEREERYVPAQELADKLGVSTRQIRKYVVNINAFYNASVILSNYRGYCMDQGLYADIQEHTPTRTIETPETRKNYILQKLICIKEGYDIFDLSDELFVSSATIETDLKEIRSILRDHNLHLIRNKNMLLVEGNEMNKRTFMSHLISSDSYDNFILKDEVQLLTFHYHFWDFRKNIRDIFSQNDIFANDYTLNNTALHLIIMIDRIRNGCIMKDEIDLDRVKKSKQYQVSTQIQSFIETTYDVKINDTELYNLVLIISNHTTILDYSFITSENISEYIEQKFIDIAHNVIRKVERNYYLDAFDEDFITKFTVHVKNLFNRVENEYYAKNPLTAKIKTSYPLIYDIAVFIAQEFKRDYQVVLNEDEIAFIAFHIGSYFENNVQSKNKVTCAFIYADYYSIHKNVLDKIMRQFDQRINMKYAISINNYNPGLLHADLIISTIDMPFANASVTIHPFLTEKDTRAIRDAIERISQTKKGNALKAYLMNFFDQRLFYKNPSFKDKEEALEIMCRDVVKLDYTETSFYEDVLAREHMSSTAFEDVAVPHSLSKNTKSSFISIAISEEAIPWGSHPVHIIALIGINEDSRKVFSEIFEEIIEILSEPVHVRELLQMQDFNEFIQHMKQLMSKVRID
ncbi:BglG family transcription antiterminator [Amedibacillus sp. YH-ame10]